MSPQATTAARQAALLRQFEAARAHFPATMTVEGEEDPVAGYARPGRARPSWTDEEQREPEETVEAGILKTTLASLPTTPFLLTLDDGREFLIDDVGGANGLAVAWSLKGRRVVPESA